MKFEVELDARLRLPYIPENVSNLNMCSLIIHVIKIYKINNYSVI